MTEARLAASPTPARARLSGATVALILLLCAGWGGLAPAIKIGLRELPPIALAAWRFLFSLAAVAAWCWLRRVPVAPGAGRTGYLGLLSATFVLQIILLNAGARTTSGGHAILLLSTHPLFVALLAHFALRGDRLTAPKVVGLLVALAGIAAVVSERLSGGSLAGDSLVLASALTLGVLVTLTKRGMERGMTAYQLLLWQMFPGVPAYFLLSRLVEGPLALPQGAAVWGSLLYQGLVVGGFCFVAWNRLLERYPASQLTAFQFTTPIYGVLFSALILGDPLTGGVVLGTLLVGAGLILANRG
ncbi:MAG: DMT family transporter [Armatimonadetes bacterium]|nr:DMT family transporter [Armatimonadota bacterium]